MTSPIVEGKLWRTDCLGNKLEDITRGMLEASVQMDTENDQTYELNAIFDYDAWLRLKPYEDWIVPELTVSWPDGTVRQGPLGLFILLDPDTTRGETKAFVHLRAMDPLWLLASQETATLPAPGRLAQLNMNMAVFLRTLLNAMIISDDPNQNVRHAIPNTAHSFRSAVEWGENDNMLDMANTVAEGMGCYPLWSSKKGVLTTSETGEKLRLQHPVRTYVANLPPNLTIADRLLPLGGMGSEIVGVISTSPGFDDLLNTVLMVNDDPVIGRIFAEARVTETADKNRRGKHHHRNRKKHHKKHNKVVPTTAVAQKVANGILDKLSTYNEIYSFEAIVDPQPDFAMAVIDLFLWDAVDRRVARAKALVHRVAYRFTASSGTMTIEAGRIDDAEGALEFVA